MPLHGWILDLLVFYSIAQRVWWCFSTWFIALSKECLCPDETAAKTGQQSDKLGSSLVLSEALAHFPLAEAQRFPFRPSGKAHCCQNADKWQVSLHLHGSVTRWMPRQLQPRPAVDTVKVMVSLCLVITLSTIVPATKGQACFDISNPPSRGTMQGCPRCTGDIAVPPAVTPSFPFSFFFRVSFLTSGFWWGWWGSVSPL